MKLIKTRIPESDLFPKLESESPSLEESKSLKIHLISILRSRNRSNELCLQSRFFQYYQYFPSIIKFFDIIDYFPDFLILFETIVFFQYFYKEVRVVVRLELRLVVEAQVSAELQLRVRFSRTQGP